MKGNDKQKRLQALANFFTRVDLELKSQIKNNNIKQKDIDQIYLSLADIWIIFENNIVEKNTKVIYTKQ